MVLDARVVVVMAAIPNWASSGHLRRCSLAETTKNAATNLVVMAAIPNWTSKGHLRHCSFADTTKNAAMNSCTTIMGLEKLLVGIFTA
eukprot:scaffold6019_cov78-Skeletonema_dohrnii-CCMP3373.AAC.4